ncbi:MAG: hypothetical protein Kow0032_08080 [Methyloligellaceae bacterium]
MAPPSPVTQARDLLIRLERVLSSAELDCRCQMAVDRMVRRFFALEHRRRLRENLHYARHQRELIVVLLTFLEELDQITPQEADPTIFGELASLFDEIGDRAGAAASALREMDVMRHPREGAGCFPPRFRKP